MVKVVGKMDLDSDSEKKLNAFKNRIIDIMTKNNKTTLPLGKVLHECGTVKADIKKSFKKYNIPKAERTNENDNFNWQQFFDENLYPEFVVENNYPWNNDSPSDALHYIPQNDTNTIGNIAVIQSNKKDKVNSTSENVDKPILDNTIEQKQTESKKTEHTKTEITMTQEEIYKLLQKLLNELNEGLFEKERSIRLTLLAVLAGESTFMLGEPGTAKSLVARRISDAFEDSKNDGEIKFFDYLMNQFSTPEEIFGPISIQELKNDKYVRKTENYLPKAQFAFLDEIWKANPAIQNALLTILNERIFRNGGQVEKVPLIGFMSASNELPEKGKGLEAIFDRFLVRILEKPIDGNDNFRKMISAERKTDATISKKLSKAIIQTILDESEAVTISDECLDIIDTLRKKLTKRNAEIQDEDEKYLVSDRRWKKIANLMRVSAYCNNRIETNIMDATIIADCIWRTEKQEEDAKIIVKEAIENYGLKCTTNFQDLESNVSKFEEKVNKKFFKGTKTGGDYQKEKIGNIVFYVVKDSCGDIHKISVDNVQYNSNLYYFDNPNSTIQGDYEYQNGQFNCWNSRNVYTIEKTKQTTTYERETFYDEKPEEGKLIVQKFNETDYLPLKKSISQEMSSIASQMEDCEKKYGDNLFSDNPYYLSVITTKLADSKVKLDDLAAKLDNQKERYDIYE